MKSHRFINGLPLMIGAPVGAALSAFTTSEISKSLDNSSILVLFFLGLFTILTKIIEETIRMSINRNISIRKTILGNNFIEGWWIEKIERVFERKGETVRSSESLSIMSIHFNDGDYLVKGHNIDKSGKLKGSFTSRFSGYDDEHSQLEYFFTSSWHASDLPETNDGYARINFQSINEKKPPFFFEGEVIILGPNANHIYINGRKVNSKFKKLDEFDTIEDFAQYLLTNFEFKKAGSSTGIEGEA